jgi:hypothetical protein
MSSRNNYTAIFTDAVKYVHNSEEFQVTAAWQMGMVSDLATAGVSRETVRDLFETPRDIFNSYTDVALVLLLVRAQEYFGEAEYDAVRVAFIEALEKIRPSYGEVIEALYAPMVDSAEVASDWQERAMWVCMLLLGFAESEEVRDCFHSGFLKKHCVRFGHLGMYWDRYFIGAKSIDVGENIPAYVDSPFGSYLANCAVGSYISLDMARKYFDYKSGQLYMVEYYEDGVAKRTILTRDRFIEELRARLKTQIPGWF